MKELNITVKPEIGFDESNLKNYLIGKGKISADGYFQITRRSVDARKNQVKVNLNILIDDQPITIDFVEYTRSQNNVSNAPQVIIVGAGPAGLFASLKAIELGYKPIIIERGKDVQSRRKDIAAINKKHIVNPDSNYCFGEGGAGTYSDGKLYTRAKKRGSVRRIFEILVAHGAPQEILLEAHPHIGTNKLPDVVAAIRNTILQHGGEIHFNRRMTDFILEDGIINGIEINNEERLSGIAVILATGHSARDIYSLCKANKIKIEAKPFALGVRVEHPQSLIDRIQYHCEERGDFLPASSYSLVHQTFRDGVKRGVFSFCMCPGGFIVPAATNPGEIVVNGMSPSKRDSKYANSGIVVAVELEDIKSFHQYQELSGMEFQKQVEQNAWEMGGNSQFAPAQRLVDFVENKISTSILPTSYQPGLVCSDMSEVLPSFISHRLKEGFKAFGKRMKGYLTNEAQIIGVESRTSSPVRIPRNKETCEHVEVNRLFPCGEGAGYAGGIASAAMDGERCMQSLALLYPIKKS